MSWVDYASAPAPGTPICRESEAGAVNVLTITTGKGDFPVLLLHTAQGWRAYVNACPHQYLPLNYRGEQLVSADGAKLICTAHGAQFDIYSGQVIHGAGCGLDAIPIEIADGEIRITLI
ncbi:Rieske 2Fe-2S domain-containing protein [Paracoccus onubensis]|uniref:Rieske (2Fe-2S) protein n=1 Tax=Paracoccus onubensis TaxID=1675788 RepID=UPI00273001CC|nr:Rieske 2Fe-2S domain-containing protein [Paracoccus onubensis]MDP0925976.1 Rieske 2Fe-2S domain-containing protein [Paracoccus onubensis]